MTKLDQATRSVLQFGLIGVALAGGFIGVLQARPSAVLPFEGTFSVQITDARFPPTLGSVADSCYSECSVSSLNLTIQSVTVHREGELNLTGGWLQVSQGTTTLDAAKITGIGQVIGQGSIPPGVINLIRLNISSAWAFDIGTHGLVQLSVPSGKVDIVLNPAVEVKSGKASTVFVDFHVSCGGNVEKCRLRPDVSQVLTPR